MHDTSAKDVFSRDIRGISHGCIRVEKPFDLAVFMLKEKNEEIIDKIKYSMNADVSSYGKKKIGGANITDTLDRSKLVNSIAVIPQIPIFITYFTLYPSTNGKLSEYADVYGYDHAIYCHLRNYR